MYSERIDTLCWYSLISQIIDYMSMSVKPAQVWNITFKWDKYSKNWFQLLYIDFDGGSLDLWVKQTVLRCPPVTQPDTCQLQVPANVG